MSSRPLHFSVMTGGGPGADGTGYSQFDQLVTLADSLEFDGFWLGHGGRGADTFQALARVVSLSERLLVGTSVVLLPLLDPTTVAQQVATLDQMSKGRFTFGTGVGGDRGADFTIHGIDPHTRGRRMDEQLEIIRRLWTGEEVEFHGKFYDVKGALQIRPYQDPMPIVIGGRGGRTPVSQRIYDRIIKWGNGWIPYITTPEYYARGQEALRERGGGGEDTIWALVQHTYVGAGDGQAALEYAVARTAANYGQAGAPPGAQAERMRPLVLAGNARACADRLIQYVDLGVREITFNLIGPPAEILDQMRRIAGDVVPLVRAHLADTAAVMPR